MPAGVGNAAFITDADENTAKVKPRGQVYSTETYGLIKNPSAIMLTSESGGVEFPTVDIGKIIIRSWSGNNVIYIGGVAEDAPYSGHGIPIWANETFTVPIANMNGVRAFAATSGNIISVMGFGTADNVSIPANDPIIPDITPPALVSVTPLDGTSGVEIDLQEITATFDDDLASGSVNTSGSSFSVRLSGSAALVSGLAYVEEAQPTMAVFAPESGQLLNSKVYVARVGPAIMGVDGNAVASAAWSFTTIASAPPPDTTRPKVSGFTPVSGATSVAISTSPMVTMSEQIQSGTATSTFFGLRLSGGTVVSNSVTLSASDLKTVTLAVSGGFLSNSGHYFIVVTSGVKDLAGNNMSGNVSGQFRTAGITLPRVSGSSPVSGETNVSISVSPTITWDRAIQSGFVSTAYFDVFSGSTLSGNQAPSIPRSFSIDDTFKIVTMNPTDDLAYSTTYKLQVQSGVKDLSGNGFSGSFSRLFTTEAQPLNIIYNVTSNAQNQLGRCADSNDDSEGLKVANASSQLKGAVPKQVRVRMAKVGSPTGNIDAEVWEGGLTRRTFFGTIDASGLTTNFADYTFTNLSATYALKAGDYILITFYHNNGFSDASNYVNIRRNNADVFDSTNTIRSIFNCGVFGDDPATEFGAIIWE